MALFWVNCNSWQIMFNCLCHISVTNLTNTHNDEGYSDQKSHIRADSQAKPSTVTTNEASSHVTEHSDCVDATMVTYKVLQAVDFVQCSVVWTTQRASSKRAASYEEALAWTCPSLRPTLPKSYWPVQLSKWAGQVAEKVKICNWCPLLPGGEISQPNLTIMRLSVLLLLTPCQVR